MPPASISPTQRSLGTGEIFGCTMSQGVGEGVALVERASPSCRRNPGRRDRGQRPGDPGSRRLAAQRIVDPAVGEQHAPADAADFMFGTKAWADDASGVTTTGVDDIDLWVGGLAEATEINGGLLGSTFDVVFQNQMTDLQDGDRLYYLARTPGMNLGTQLEGNSFAEMILRNTAGTDSLSADAFGTSDCKFQLKDLDGTAAGFDALGPRSPTTR